MCALSKLVLEFNFVRILHFRNEPRVGEKGDSRSCDGESIEPRRGSQILCAAL